MGEVSSAAPSCSCATFEFPSSETPYRVCGRLWLPPDGTAIRATVQVVHGMAEHIGRYDSFARELASRGCAVAGHDHIGHGLSVDDRSAWGDLPPNRGADALVHDALRVHRILGERFPQAPHMIVGHSMGSFVVRTALGTYRGSDSSAGVPDFAGAVVMGTGWQPRFALAAGRFLTAAIGVVSGWGTRSRLVDSLAVGAYAKAFSEDGDLGWLTRDAEGRNAYAADPACGFIFTVGAYHELFRLVGMAQNRRVVSGMPDNLPVYLMSGSDDPVGGMGKAVPNVAALMRSCGVRDVETRIYPRMRHELLNEMGREAVLADMLVWMERKGILNG